MLNKNVKNFKYKFNRFKSLRGEKAADYLDYYVSPRNIKKILLQLDLDTIIEMLNYMKLGNYYKVLKAVSKNKLKSTPDRIKFLTEIDDRRGAIYLSRFIFEEEYVNLISKLPVEKAYTLQSLQSYISKSNLLISKINPSFAEALKAEAEKQIKIKEIKAQQVTAELGKMPLKYEFDKGYYNEKAFLNANNILKKVFPKLVAKLSEKKLKVMPILQYNHDLKKNKLSTVHTGKIVNYISFATMFGSAAGIVVAFNYFSSPLIITLIAVPLALISIFSFFVSEETIGTFPDEFHQEISRYNKNMKNILGIRPVHSEFKLTWRVINNTVNVLYGCKLLSNHTHSYLGKTIALLNAIYYMPKQLRKFFQGLLSFGYQVSLFEQGQDLFENVKKYSSFQNYSSKNIEMIDKINRRETKYLIYQDRFVFLLGGIIQGLKNDNYPIETALSFIHNMLAGNTIEESIKIAIIKSTKSTKPPNSSR